MIFRRIFIAIEAGCRACRAIVDVVIINVQMPSCLDSIEHDNHCRHFKRRKEEYFLRRIYVDLVLVVLIVV
jgi:hypothetical protein